MRRPGRTWKSAGRSGFPVSKDIELGAQVAAQIDTSSEFVLLPETGNEVEYAYLNAIKTELLNSGKFKYKDQFAWKLHIVDNDEVLNAFATPGGYIYIYTGLIKYLDNVHDLTGVIGHELAHADRRHSTEQLKKNLGTQLLLNLLLGDSELLGQVVGGLLSLKFSKTDESDADAHAVIYTSPTRFACNGVAGFFERLVADGQGGGVPEFLSTHPAPENRVVAINERASCMSCSTQKDDILINGLTYAQFKPCFKLRE
ncbi:MAG: M48 family metalloprotease [Cytophagales bacterium]|nr:M48 family metalloprotease [Cytophagales bacterium]